VQVGSPTPTEKINQGNANDGDQHATSTTCWYRTSTKRGGNYHGRKRGNDLSGVHLELRHRIGKGS
jgi:hypothetical protein